MNNADTIEEILLERDREYGPFSMQACTVAALWSEHLGFTIRPVDVPIMMILFKIARGLEKKDTLLDIAGYAVLAADMDAPRL
jgi:hypothetical protein